MKSPTLALIIILWLKCLCASSSSSSSPSPIIEINNQKNGSKEECQGINCNKVIDNNVNMNNNPTDVKEYQKKHRLLATQYTDVIRIFIAYDASQNAQITDIMNAAVIFFQNLLKMNTPINNSITFASKSCSACDILLVVDNATKCAYLYPTVELTSDTILAGTIKFCQLADTVFKSNYKFKKMVDSVIHGIMKIITFKQANFKADSCNATTNKCISSASTYSNLKSKFISLYGQMSQASLPVQDINTSYYLWDKQYAYEDLMTDNFFDDEKVWSSFNNQILKDLPIFSSVNDQMVETITIVPQPFKCDIKNSLFCLEQETSLSCNAALTAKSRCSLFADKTCRVYMPVDEGSCYNDSTNDSQASLISATGTYESYGWNSRCFQSDIQDISSLKYTAPIRCYKYSCDGNDNVTIYLDTSDSGNNPAIDVVTCTPDMKNTFVNFKNLKYYSSTGLQCPSDNKIFCNAKAKPCKNFCSSKGVCTGGQCSCLTDYYGDDCSCYKSYQFNGKCVSVCPTKMTGDNPNHICKPICQGNYFFSSDIDKCSECDQNCKSCWDSSKKCDSCNDGFLLFTDYTCKQIQVNALCTAKQYYDGSTCINCDSTCKACAFSNTFCTACLSNQVLVQNKCTDCPPNCLSCTDKQLCTQCKDGTFLTQLQNECISQCLIGIGYLNTCVATCPQGFFENTATHLCEACDSTCLSCISQSTSCTDCEYFRQLQPNKTCKDICDSNYVYVRTSSGVIEWNFECKACSYLEKCAECQGNVVSCTKCLPGFYLFGIKCLENCQSGYYADDNLYQCIQCDSNCLTCSIKSKTCTSCQVDQFLKVDMCVSNCGDGYIANTDNKKCEVTRKTSDETTSNSNFSSNLKFQGMFIIILFITMLI